MEYDRHIWPDHTGNRMAFFLDVWKLHSQHYDFGMVGKWDGHLKIATLFGEKDD